MSTRRPTSAGRGLPRQDATAGDLVDGRRRARQRLPAPPLINPTAPGNQEAEDPLRLRLIAVLGLPALIFAACETGSPSETGARDAETGSGGATGSGSGGASAQGGSGGGTGAGGTMGVGGGAGTTGAGGHASGGAGAAGSAGTGGAGGSAGMGGAGGATGTGGAGGGGGVTSTTTSGSPLPPGASNVPKPSGTAGNITVLNWAGFKGAVTYTFDDDNVRRLRITQLQALGVPYTFYLWTGKTRRFELGLGDRGQGRSRDR